MGILSFYVITGGIGIFLLTLVGIWIIVKSIKEDFEDLE